MITFLVKTRGAKDTNRLVKKAKKFGLPFRTISPNANRSGWGNNRLDGIALLPVDHELHFRLKSEAWAAADTLQNFCMQCEAEPGFKFACEHSFAMNDGIHWLRKSDEYWQQHEPGFKNQCKHHKEDGRPKYHVSPYGARAGVILKRIPGVNISKVIQLAIEFHKLKRNAEQAETKLLAFEKTFASTLPN